jgi:hypothetical protein
MATVLVAFLCLYLASVFVLLLAFANWMSAASWVNAAFAVGVASTATLTVIGVASVAVYAAAWLCQHIQWVPL